MLTLKKLSKLRQWSFARKKITGDRWVRLRKDQQRGQRFRFMTSSWIKSISAKPRQTETQSATICIFLGMYHIMLIRADSRFAPSQWETALLCNDVSHWLGANLGSSLYMLLFISTNYFVCCINKTDRISLTMYWSWFGPDLNWISGLHAYGILGAIAVRLYLGKYKYDMI